MRSRTFPIPIPEMQRDAANFGVGKIEVAEMNEEPSGRIGLDVGQHSCPFGDDCNRSRNDGKPSIYFYDTSVLFRMALPMLSFNVMELMDLRHSKEGRADSLHRRFAFASSFR